MIDNSTKDKLENETPHFGNTLLGAVPSVVYNEDCVEGLKRFSDKYFDLAIVDPPYGIDLGNNSDYFAYKGGIRGKKGLANDKKDWDKERPTDEYWNELFRVSKNQIVWGGNFFTDKLKISRGWICWDKKQPETNTFSDFDLAWTSFDCINRTFRMYPTHVTQGKKIHPSQKPKELYEFVLKYYGADANLILDTHVGSGSSRIACNKAGKQFVGFEIDEDYYEAQEKRFKDFVSQLRMF